MADFRDNGFLHDIGKLEDRAAASVLTLRLAALIDATAAHWSNLGAAKDTALDDEGITASERNALIGDAADSAHLWNYFKRLIELLEPTAIPQPRLFRRIAAASKTKCGYSVGVGNKVFRTATQSGTITGFTPGGGLGPDYTITYAVTGSMSKDRATCVESGTIICTVTETFDPDPGGASGSESHDLPAFNSICDATPGTGVFGTGINETTATYSLPGPENTGTLTLTLSDEYTTAELIADVEGAIPAFAGDYILASAASGRNLSPTEATYSAARVQFLFELPDLTGFDCYKITWDEVFYPEDGGASSVVASRSYLWDGSAAFSPPYTVDQPSADGEIRIENIVGGCDCA